MPQRFFGWRGPGLPDQRDFLFAARPETLRILPPSLDLDTPSPGAPYDPVFDQGALGSCGPNSVAGNIVFDELKVTPGRGVMPSRLFIYYCTRLIMGTVNSDSGVDNRSLMKAIQRYGWCDEASWPYDVSAFTKKPPQECFDAAAARKIGQYLSVPQTLQQMKGCLFERFPFIFGFTVYESFDQAVGGDVPMPGSGERVEGGHDVIICGYDDPTQRFKFRNSWGRDWGRDGYGTIPYAYALSSKLSGDFWTVRSSGIAPVPPAPPPPPPPPVPTGLRITVPAAIPAGEYTLSKAQGLAAPRRRGGRKTT